MTDCFTNDVLVAGLIIGFIVGFAASMCLCWICIKLAGE
jgi:hypothetical protein